MNNSINKEKLLEVRSKISFQVKRTPIFTSKLLNELFDCNLFFKCENFQKAGAFKFRGASNAVLSLTRDNDLSVVTHSSGNHAAALALASSMRKIPAYIIMPENAPRIKINAVQSYGGKIVFCKPTLAERERTCNEIMEQTGAVLIHPYNNYDIIAGQASCAAEIIEDVPNADYIISPVGGGGLLSGSCLSAHYFGEGIQVLGAEPKGADDAYRSLRDKIIYPSVNPNTIADGLLTSLGDKTYPIIAEFCAGILTVNEESIIKCMRLIWERMKIIIEPSSAVTLAVVSENQRRFQNKNVALILSGGNVDLDRLPWLKNVSV